MALAIKTTVIAITAAITGKWSDQLEYIILRIVESSDNCHLLRNREKSTGKKIAGLALVGIGTIVVLVTPNVNVRTWRSSFHSGDSDLFLGILGKDVFKHRFNNASQLGRRERAA